MKTATLTSDQKRLAKMLKALGNPVRFQIVELLAENQMCITNDIVRQMPLAQSTVSQHLKVLRESGLIDPTLMRRRRLCLLQHGDRLRHGLL